MGGGAFAQAYARDEPTLTVPRMQPSEYAKLKEIYLKKLQKYFSTGTVACLIEAPEKIDYGDIDIFVAIDQRVDFVGMANEIRAAGVICHSSGKVQKCSLGVLLDGSDQTRPVVVYKHLDAKADSTTAPSAVLTVDDYAQIDVEIISPQMLEWHKFYSSYGDLAGLLGHIVHNLGFTVSDRGLWLRLSELDHSKTVDYVNIGDKDGKILLSSCPGDVMKFLGLSVEAYEEGFRTLDALYEWLEKCTLLSVDAIKITRNGARERNKEQRMIFTRFFSEWLPSRLGIDEEDGAKDRTAIVNELRKIHLNTAIDFFNKRQEYEKMHIALTLTIENAMAAELLKPMIKQFSEKEGKLLNEIVRSFRRYVGFGADGAPCVLETPHSDADSQLYHFLAKDRLSLQDPDETSRWVGANWAELRSLGRRRIATPALEESVRDEVIENDYVNV